MCRGTAESPPNTGLYLSPMSANRRACANFVFFPKVRFSIWERHAAPRLSHLSYGLWTDRPRELYSFFILDSHPDFRHREKEDPVTCGLTFLVERALQSTQNGSSGENRKRHPRPEAHPQLYLQSARLRPMTGSPPPNDVHSIFVAE